MSGWPTILEDMKAARLVSEIVILAARSHPITAEALANRLEVTERTIYRDIGELSGMGVPVITQAGAGGGISLLGEWASPVSGMTRDELDSVLIGSLAAADLGLASESATARAKMLTATESVLSASVLVDGPDWFMAQESPEHLASIASALRAQTGLRIVYLRSGIRSVRTLAPLGLVVKAGRWYLVAQAPGGIPRTYRVSRIVETSPRYRRMTGPTGFDLGEYWQRSQAAFDASIRTTSVRLRIPEARIPDLLRAVPGRVTDHAIEHARLDDGIMELELPMEPGEIAVSQLITVPEVEVVSPLTIRRSLRAHASAAAKINH